MRTRATERPKTPRHTQPIVEQAQTAGYLYRLRSLSGLDWYEREFVCRWIAHGLQTAGDKRCLKAMAKKYLGVKDGN